MPAPPGVSIERWASDSEVDVIQDLRDAGKDTSKVIWIDVADATDVGALADLLDAMALSNPGEGHSAWLAPTVVEVIQRERVVERRVVGFDEQWPLPTPDGVEGATR